ncbi:low molecular weight phosphotyrosine protein phosphatase [Aquihabitans sp. G128]|uniref:low molecular weight protein-tyrosine-phosphatase n=1 Tax=Aquihabitans sp. G128 TaxID=2849779 RepID=UPI001C2288D7|nr:low molecular weight protein-tyrosine-phosphatase [Aquihabitans sp. G128]QXC59587.1 low molecular weight phosphotyrosine protein phosphatase [Aquihabitans sp. G128]
MTASVRRVTFVCLGNICRSPLASAALRHLADEHGVADRLVVDSAGTAGYHEGEGADPRTTAALDRHGLPVGHRARQFRAADFATRDLVVALDRANAEDLRRLAPTPEEAAKVVLLRDFDPGSPADSEVPDPWYGNDDDFDLALHLIEASLPGLLDALLADDGPPASP